MHPVTPGVSSPETSPADHRQPDVPTGPGSRSEARRLALVKAREHQSGLLTTIGGESQGQAVAAAAVFEAVFAAFVAVA